MIDQSVILVEGSEDRDLLSKGRNTLSQCKMYLSIHSLTKVRQNCSSCSLSEPVIWGSRTQYGPWELNKSYYYVTDEQLLLLRGFMRLLRYNNAPGKLAKEKERLKYLSTYNWFMSLRVGAFHLSQQISASQEASFCKDLVLLIQWGVRVWTGHSWLRIGFCSRLIWTR